MYSEAIDVDQKARFYFFCQISLYKQNRFEKTFMKIHHRIYNEFDRKLYEKKRIFMIKIHFNENQNVYFMELSAFVLYIAALNFLFNWTLIYLLFTMSTTPISWTWNKNRCFIFEIELTKIEGRISQVNFTGCFAKSRLSSYFSCRNILNRFFLIQFCF